MKEVKKTIPSQTEKKKKEMLSSQIIIELTIHHAYDKSI